MRLAAGAIAVLLVLAAGCGGGDRGERGAAGSPDPAAERYSFGEGPAVPDGSLATEVDVALDALLSSSTGGELDRGALEDVAGSGDARLGWLVSDLLRFSPVGEPEDRLVVAFEQLTGTDVRDDPDFARSAWQSVTNHLIAWDLPAPSGYRERKAELYLAVEPAWQPFFADADSELDWRLISWGGVQIDDRAAGDERPCPRGCIPALDDPTLTAATDGGWYPDNRIVFGLALGGEAVALPKNIMEVHELVNITIGGRRVGIPYCTLCGSAQAYYLDSVPEGLAAPVLRTSGLLSRSNKLMYDLNTRSAIDTFTGRALSGPLHESRVALEQTTVVTSTWGAWKEAHPETRIIARDGGVGQRYPLDPLGGRDDDGPIFPIGDVDPRLPVQAQVVGVEAPGGGFVAFPADPARSALAGGERVRLAGVELVAEGDGLRARTRDGTPLASHEAFWFAWSQFHPGTQLWSPVG